MRTLFEITQDVIELASLLEEGEYTPELEERLNISREELEEKAINYGKVIKQIKGETATIDAEINRLVELRASKERVIERMKESVSNAMQIFKVDKIQTPLMKISFRKSEVLEIVNESLIYPRFKIIKETITIDKAKIKKLLKDGTYEFIPGVKIVEKQNLQIK